MFRAIGLFVVSLGLIGCSSTGGAAYRTGDLVLPAYAGPISIYASANPPSDATDLGVIEVHATEDEGTVQTLLPLFLQKVGSLGGDVAVIDAIHAHFEKTARIQIDTYYATCASGVPCAGKHGWATNDEVMTVSIVGRAMTRRKLARPDLIPTPPSPATPHEDDLNIGGETKQTSEPAKPEEKSP